MASPWLLIFCCWFLFVGFGGSSFSDGSVQRRQRRQQQGGEEGEDGFHNGPFALS
jgi:hypothetical protein